MERVTLKYRISEYSKNTIDNDYYKSIAPYARVTLINDITGEEVGKIKDISLAMQKYGLAWSEKYNSYTLSNYYYNSPDLYIQFMTKLDEIIKKYNNHEQIISNDEREREKQQSYYTGSLYRDILCIFLSQIDEDSIILDPAAGEGALLNYFSPSQVIAIEPNNLCCQILTSKGYTVINDTFENAYKKGIIPTPTHIIMNPPFCNRNDIIFFNLAYSILQNGGSLSTIVSENSIWEELKKYSFIDNSMSLEKIAYILIKQVNATDLSIHLKTFLEIILDTHQKGIISIQGLSEIDSTWGRCQDTSARMFVIKLRKPYKRIKYKKK